MVNVTPLPPPPCFYLSLVAAKVIGSQNMHLIDMELNFSTITSTSKVRKTCIHKRELPSYIGEVLVKDQNLRRWVKVR